MNLPKKIRVLLADDTAIARMGMAALLENVPDIDLLDQVTIAQAVPIAVIEREPDVLLLDLNWFDDESAGEATIRQIKHDRPQTRIIAITAYKHLVEGARRAGAEAALSKNITKLELLTTIRSVYQSPFPAAERVLQAEVLSDREKQVLDNMALGKTAKEIAKELMIEEATVRHHMTNIREKLGATNNTQAVAIAYQQGLFSSTDKSNG